MTPRYATRPGHHQALGEVVEVYDLETRRTIAPYSGPFAQERAQQRAEELNAENDRASRDDGR